MSKKLEKEQVLTALSQNIQLAAIIQPASEKKPDKIRKLVDIQANVAAGKGIGYELLCKRLVLPIDHKMPAQLLEGDHAGIQVFDHRQFITDKKLSKKLEKEQVQTALSQNIQLAVTIQPASEQKPDKIRKLVDIQANVAAGKGIGYERWAKKFNLKRWSQTLILLQEKGLTSEDALHQRIAELQTQHDDALAVVKDMDARMVSLKELRGHLVVYRQYKPRTQQTLHGAAP